jgi:hypothetical protein
LEFYPILLGGHLLYICVLVFGCFASAALICTIVVTFVQARQDSPHFCTFYLFLCLALSYSHFSLLELLGKIFHHTIHTLLVKSMLFVTALDIPIFQTPINDTSSSSFCTKLWYPVRGGYIRYVPGRAEICGFCYCQVVDNSASCRPWTPDVIRVCWADSSGSALNQK